MLREALRRCINSTVQSPCSFSYLRCAILPCINRHQLAKKATMSCDPRPMIGVCQLTCTADKEQNFQICKTLIERAKKKGAMVSEIYSCNMPYCNYKLSVQVCIKAKIKYLSVSSHPTYPKIFCRP